MSVLRGFPYKNFAGLAVDKAPTSKTDRRRVQDAFNQWHGESGWPLAHISKTLACSVGDEPLLFKGFRQ